ncbi:DMT family transporter [Ramlibacter sp.]|uniref:DMT family transporter n=1 Tax=Ramlibacter sp. TaxID=1917967 RepID=UPI003D09DCA9
MLLSSFFFATMAVCVKIASEWFGTAEILFYRGAIGMLLMWLWARSRGETLATAYGSMHLWRSVVGVISLGAWFYSIAYLPVATAMTLNYMSSVWIAVFLIGGALFAWNPRDGLAAPLRQGPLAATVAAGFAGVVLMLRPTLEQDQLFAAVIGLLSGLTAAIAYLQVMALGRLGEPETRTVFYFALGSAIGGLVGMLATGTAVGTASDWHWSRAGWLLPIGLLAALGQFCMTRAYAETSTLVVANLQYSGIVFGALYSLLLFGDRIPLLGWAGMALIVASGIAATVLRARAAPDSPAEEH